MNKHLAKALAELKALHAQGVPDADEIVKAEDGVSWSGKLQGGGAWKLIKHHPDSFTTNTRKNIPDAE